MITSATTNISEKGLGHMTMKKDVDTYFSELTGALSRIDRDTICEMVDAILEAYNNESVVYVCGNGGSAATASHIVCDFNKGISMHHDKKFRFLCLNDNIASMMAISNDISYDDVFLIQAEGRVRDGDVLIAISGSGNSENVLKVAEYFKNRGNKVIGLTGYSGGKLREMADIPVHVPVNDMQKAEDAHMSVLHLCAQIIARELGHPLC